MLHDGPEYSNDSANSFNACGQLHLTCHGDPVRISVCHCNACQRRTGSAFGYQARFPRNQVSDIGGDETQFIRTGDSGKQITAHFCPHCGTTVYWELGIVPDLIAVAAGAFADPDFQVPRHSVYESRRHSWTLFANDREMEHLA